MATRFVRRQADAVADDIASDSDDFIMSDYDESELWPGYSSWEDGYSSDLRWAAIGILIGVVIAVWLPWFIVTMKVSLTSKLAAISGTNFFLRRTRAACGTWSILGTKKIPSWVQ